MTPTTPQGHCNGTFYQRDSGNPKCGKCGALPNEKCAETKTTKETVQDRVKRGDYSDYKSGDGPSGQVTGIEIVGSKTTNLEQENSTLRSMNSQLEARVLDGELKIKNMEKIISEIRKCLFNNVSGGISHVED